jgi:two-component system, LytTR family, response regulator LytT
MDAQLPDMIGIISIGYNSSFMRSRATAPMSAIIADDEQLARDELKFLLDQIGDVEVVAVASHGLEALDAIERLDPALAFLDIQMPGLDGLSVVRRLRERQIEPPHVIFSTAYDQFAVEAFRLDAMDYILKPVERERLEETIGRARRIVADRIIEPVAVAPARSNGAFTKLLLRNGTRNLIVDPQELIFATIDSGVITLVTAQMEGQANFRTLEDLQAALDPDLFWRAHRSFVVNINKIREVVPWFKSTYQLKMDDKKATEIPVSRMQSRRLREMLNL